MRTILMMALFGCLILSGFAADGSIFYPPAVPLVACDPYFSIWSPADKLTDAPTCHWTGKRQAMTSLIRIDGTTYQIMGNQPRDLPVMEQVGLSVLPTRTIYTFKAAGVEAVLTFLQPALPDDIEWMSSPVVFLNWHIRATDGKSHDVAVYFDSTAEPAVNEPSQEVDFFSEKAGSLSLLRTGTTSQNILGRKGDDLRIDWGYYYVAAQQSNLLRSMIDTASYCRSLFISSSPAEDSRLAPGKAPVSDEHVLAMVSKPMKIDSKSAGFQVILAYDDIYSILYFGQKLRPFWKRGGLEFGGLLQKASSEYSTLLSRCEAFDKELMSDMEAVGGRKYALMASLAYRQCIGANKIAADKNGMPLVFPKENHSNGCIATVDVFYPMAPQFLLLNPMLAKGAFIPVLDYAQSDRWKFPFAPHDLGTYPMAMGQVYGGGETGEKNQMPVEECGNMLILVAAVCQAEGRADFARQYWPLMTQWAQYLESKGLDPENQLCTDDFAGHLAHNVNLSAKAIMGLAAYGKMAGMLGYAAESRQYLGIAGRFAKEWLKMADDGDHYRLAFDKPGTWSQKYNLVWDRLLGLNIFPPDVAKKEIAYYRTVQNTYGLPLDNRSQYTKLDWIFWTATLTGDRRDFEDLTDPVYTFLARTPDRCPMTDWYWTHDAKKKRFTARPVVGGLFIKMLDDASLWKKWVGKAQYLTSPWAPLPALP